MVRFVTLLTTLAGMSAVMCAPTDGVSITVKNNCANSIQVNQLTNEQATSDKSSVVSAGDSTTINVGSTWGGRIWAREGCSGDSDCQVGAPASLAEFLMGGALGKDYYDVSFVDGFNLPIQISANSGSGSGAECGSPTCATLPTCDGELEYKDSNGKAVACKSACSAFSTDEYCCTGSFGRGVCDANKYSIEIKNACPDVYSYANDDSSSMYACQSTDYTVTFCPA
ncbi:thaumatin [Mucor mucedo]|uniref:thaumatin n=1 Tax=Mucor mucedo TaxID=29922 RepID=UPI0022201DE5|nr:thaumatin [Mucor mucedo]KAI7893409.1 thaumatin [Mucor mucedo]